MREFDDDFKVWYGAEMKMLIKKGGWSIKPISFKLCEPAKKPPYDTHKHILEYTRINKDGTTSSFYKKPPLFTMYEESIKYSEFIELRKAQCEGAVPKMTSSQRLLALISDLSPVLDGTIDNSVGDNGSENVVLPSSLGCASGPSEMTSKMTLNRPVPGVESPTTNNIAPTLRVPNAKEIIVIDLTEDDLDDDDDDDENIDENMENNSCKRSWLAAQLLKDGLSLQQVKECEQALLVQEGFVEECDFAEAGDIDAVYLNSIGITGKGTQKCLLKRHRELHTEYAIRNKRMRILSSSKKIES